jgi:nicotinate phosphoribosyltransferase
MGQAVFHLFSTVNVEYTFKCRTENVTLRHLLPQIIEEINHYCTLKFTTDEIEYLRSLGYFKDDYLDFLKDFQPNIGHVFIYTEPQNGVGFNLRVIGSWLDTILFETPILAIISEIYSKSVWPHPLSTNLFERIGGGLSTIKHNNAKFADFGTRRRFSKDWQDLVVWHLSRTMPQKCVGTSNPFLAKKHCVKPVGTMAHEWLQVGQALTRLELSQRFMLEMWLKEYGGQLGIALTDVIGMDAFLKDFDSFLANAYDGCRQDSGNPFEWCNKLINHYKKLDIDPKTKIAIFSDGLFFKDVVDLYIEFKDKINVLFGIGTSLTNNIGINPLQIVMKITKANNQPVAKISDSPGKGMCGSDAYVERLKLVYGIE